MAQRFRRIPVRIPVEGKPLGRHIEHDRRSLLYRAARAETVATVLHARHIPVLDQGQVGACTGNAETGVLGSDPIYSTLPGGVSFQLDEAYAVGVYSDATKIDGVDGQYPPDDTGSSGLAVMKVAKARGLISGYTTATSVDEIKSTLQSVPGILGIPWYQGFDEPGADGMVSISGKVRGGHEIELIGWDADSDVFTCVNSWSESWGDQGRFRFTSGTLARLLKSRGDFYAPVPLSQPAPTPTPVPTDSIWPGDVVDPWLLKKHGGQTGQVATALIALRSKLQ